MAAPKGRPKPVGSGRKAGTPNKSTAEFRQIAQTYCMDALKALCQIMNDKDSPHASRITASRTFLEYGYGKPDEIRDYTGLGIPAPQPVGKDVHAQLRAVIDRLANMVTPQVGSDQVN